MEKNADDSDTIIDKGTLDDTSCFDEGRVTPTRMLSFAKQILLMLGFMFEIAAVFEIYIPGNGVYETCKVTIPSLATLVIGYYFGSTKS